MVPVLPGQRDHDDPGVKSSTKRREPWATETDEVEKQRSRKRRRANRRLRNHGTKALRRNLQPRVRRQRPRSYHKAKSPRDNAPSLLGRSSVRPAASRICPRYGFLLPIYPRIRWRFYTIRLARRGLPCAWGSGESSRTFCHSLEPDEDDPLALRGRSAGSPQAFRTDGSGCHPCSR